MQFLPIFFNLAATESLVVGGGQIALRKIESLLNANGKVRVVAKSACSGVLDLAAAQKIELQLRAFAAHDLDAVALVIAATADLELNAKIAAQARREKILVNVVDQPQLCNFIMPSVVDRSPVVVAVSTGGAAPVLARLLRARLETLIPYSYGQLAEIMRDFRARVRKRIPDGTARRRFWEKALSGSVAERIYEGKHEAALESLENLLEHNEISALHGEVYLVGGGPGDPDLLTFRALRLMQQADVVVYDRLVAPAIVALARKDAERIFVGKRRDAVALRQEEINELLVRLSSEGRRVLRLKGGDPFIFGRGGEEIETLAEHGIPFQIVPGITAANGCAAYAGIPLTHRDYAQQCLFVTGHQRDGQIELPWDAVLQPDQTVAIYMGMHGLEALCSGLLARGMRAQMPVAVIERGTTTAQRVLVSEIAQLAEQARAANFSAPSIIILGDVVRLHEKLQWF